MRDLAGVPNYKVLLHIACGDGNADVLLDEIFLAIHEHICQFVDPIPFSLFKSHAKAASDKGVRVNIASCHAAPPFTKISWATRMSLMDSIVKRRRWTVHIGLRYEEGDSTVKLFYAEYYSDFTAGRLSAPPPPPKITPFFVHSFVCNPAFQCVAENHPLPYDDIELSPSTMPILLRLLDQGVRTLPIFVLTCPDALNPRLLSEIMIGNGMVFTATDPDVIAELNSSLPNSKKIIPDSLQTHLPAESFTRCLSAEVLRRYGVQTVLLSLRRAHCECMRYDERAQFHTYEDIIEMRRRDRIAKLEESINSLQKEIVPLQASNARLLEQNISLKESLATMEAELNRDLIGELHQYEDEWTKCQNQLCELKGQITEVVAGMYRREVPRLDKIPCCAEIAHLLEATGFFAHPLSPNSAK